MKPRKDPVSWKHSKNTGSAFFADEITRFAVGRLVYAKVILPDEAATAILADEGPLERVQRSDVGSQSLKQGD